MSHRHDFVRDRCISVSSILIKMVRQVRDQFLVLARPKRIGLVAKPEGHGGRNPKEEQKMAEQADDLGIPMKPERRKEAATVTPTDPPKPQAELAERPAFLREPSRSNPAPALASISSRLSNLNRPGAEAAHTPPPSRTDSFIVLTDGAVEARKLIVGRGTSLSGEINSCDRLVVEGSAQGNLQHCQHMTIAENGSFDGNASINDAEIRGRFQGELTVRGRLVIRASGNVTGTITYAEIEIEAGGRISGTVKSL